MKRIIGDTKIFAIEIDLMKLEPSIWGTTALWINNKLLGDPNDENILGPFIRSMMRAAIEYDTFKVNDFVGMECRKAFYKMYPFYNEQDKLEELSKDEISNYKFYDNLRLYFGENFDSWIINLLVYDNTCRFYWVHLPERGSDPYNIRNDIKCAEVPLKKVQDAYRQICQLIPDPYWPAALKKL